jgi:hypothetical protein
MAAATEEATRAAAALDYDDLIFRFEFKSPDLPGRASESDSVQPAALQPAGNTATEISNFSSLGALPEEANKLFEANLLWSDDEEDELISFFNQLGNSEMAQKESEDPSQENTALSDNALEEDMPFSKD